MPDERGTSRSALRRVQALIMFACWASLCGHAAEAAPIVSETAEVETARYLSQFGYLPPAVDPMNQSIVSEESLSKAIAEYQSFVRINVTGKMDAETAHWMSLPRCGVKDEVEAGPKSSRTKRYAWSNSTWPRTELTYKISGYTTKLDDTVVDQVIRRAFDIWSEHTNFTFSLGSGEVDIDISFQPAEHGDGTAFTENVLAHAFGPDPDSSFRGQVHFYEAINWTVNSTYGDNLLSTAVHEIGHALGLGHSRVHSAIMFFYYIPVPIVKLHMDDIAGIQALYSDSNIGENAPEICEDPYIDAIYTSPENDTFVFKRQWYWKLISKYETVAAPGYPKLIAERWPHLPNNIDLVVTNKNGETCFFTEDAYTCYNGEREVDGYPRGIDEHLFKKPADMIKFEKALQNTRYSLPIEWGIRCGLQNVPDLWPENYW